MKEMRLFTTIFSLIGLCLILIGGYVALRTQRFLGNAVSAEGTVVELVRSVSSRSGRRSGSSKTYRPVVQFTTADGRPIEMVSSVGSNPPAYSVGERVGVWYDPTRPEDAKLAGFLSLWFLPLLFTGIGAVFASIGLGIALAARAKARRAARLRQEGTPIQTTFQSVDRNTSVRINGRHPFRIVSQWQNPATGEVHVFESDNLWFDPSQYLTGRHVTVYIERDNPGKYWMDLSFLPRMAE
ncbi:MAG TPA: DUF3592 domain-containing protein [Thermoanaerobaculia bacterium]|nr:DUF3592 domain-containing protein [Thermoanaerobaculia bacterium]